MTCSNDVCCRFPQAAHISQTFDAFTCSLCGLIDGSCNVPQFESYCRQYLGYKSYPLFTTDRLIALVIKQLHLLTRDKIYRGLYAPPYHPPDSTRMAGAKGEILSKPQNLLGIKYPGTRFPARLHISDGDIDLYMFKVRF